MRILFLDADIRYASPTRMLQPHLLALSGQVSFFGPGYVSSAVLAKGLECFAAENGPYDVVVATEHILFAEDYVGPHIVQSYRRNYSFLFPLKDLEKRTEILRDFRRMSPLKVAFLLESDYYNFGASQIERLQTTADILVGWDETFVSPRAQLPGLSQESFAAHVNDEWANFVTAHRHKMVPLVHCVGTNEFCFTALAHRSADWSVPGTPYTARRNARAALKKAGDSLSRGRPLPIAPVLTRLGLRPFSWPLFIDYYQAKFREEITGARFAFTCGSGLRWPIRKYFEIPALGAILTCLPCNGFEALGFRDGENAILCEPNDLPNLGRRLRADLDAAQAIADAGRRLVSERHTVMARAEQLKTALVSALAGQWAGAHWVDGRMVPAVPAYGSAKTAGTSA